MTAIIITLVIGIIIGSAAVIVIALCNASGRQNDREEDDFRRWLESLERKNE